MKSFVGFIEGEYSKQYVIRVPQTALAEKCITDGGRASLHVHFKHIDFNKELSRQKSTRKNAFQHSVLVCALGTLQNASGDAVIHSDFSMGGLL